MDPSDEDSWIPAHERIPERKDALAFEVQDEESDEDEEQHKGPILRQSAGAGSADQSAAPFVFPSSSTVPAPPRKQQLTAEEIAAVADMSDVDAPDDGPDDEDDEGSASEHEDDDDELGGHEGDEQFQRMLELMQQQAAGGTKAGAAEPDLLSQILKGGSSTWKASAAGGLRSREGDEGDAAASSSSSTHVPGASVAEEVVEYQIYVDDLNDAGSQTLADPSVVLARLAALRTAVLTFMQPTTHEYIWQNEALQLHVCAPHVHTTASSDAAASAAASSSAAAAAAASSTAAPARSPFAPKHASSHSRLLPHLHGSTHFGDNIEDEWFIVYLLLTLTSHYPDVSVCLSDSDGSFLCIELAEVLPEYLRPENAANRVWLRRGGVHLVPPPATPAQLATIPVQPTIEQALRILREQTVPTAAASEVQRALLDKLAPFFAAASSASAPGSFLLASPALASMHQAKVALPLSLALLLQRYPQLLAEWAQNFMLRDAVDMKRGNKMERVLGCSAAASTGAASAAAGSSASAIAAAAAPAMSGSASVPFVFLRVRFTHCLYAQLLQQRFAPSRVLARHLHELSASASPSSSAQPGPALARALDLGAKIATGAEMWYANARSTLRRSSARVAAAREKIGGANNPALRRKDEALDLANEGLPKQFGSLAAVETFLASSSSSSLHAPLLQSWRCFVNEAERRKIPALVAQMHPAAPSSSLSAAAAAAVADDKATSVCCTRLLASFLYSRYQPHCCVDLESADELFRDPSALPAFSLEDQPRPESSANVPPTARVLQSMDELCDACAATPAATANAAASSSSSSDSSSAASLVASLPEPFRPAATSLLLSQAASSFSSLPADDSDAWLTLSPAELESMLAKAGSASASAAAQDGRSQMDSGGAGAYDGAAIVQSMHKFVSTRSEVAGVEAPKSAAAPAAAASSSGSRSKTASSAPSATSSSALTTEGKKVSFAPSVSSSSSSSSVPPAAASLPPLNVDDRELMRLLASMQGEMASFNAAAAAAASEAAATPAQKSAPHDAHGSFNATLLGSSGQQQHQQRSSIKSSQLPSSDSEDEEDEKKKADDDIDSEEDVELYEPDEARKHKAAQRARVIIEDDDDEDKDELMNSEGEILPTALNTRPGPGQQQMFGGGASNVTQLPPGIPAWAAKILQAGATPATPLAAATAAPVKPAVAPSTAAAAAAKPAAPSAAGKQQPPRSAATSRKAQPTSASHPPLREYMDAMDDELQRAGLQSDFVRESDAAAVANAPLDSASSSAAAAASAAPSSSSGPVDVDTNLLANLLRSHDSERAQGGTHAGPVTSILASMGIALPPNDDEQRQEQKQPATGSTL